MNYNLQKKLEHRSYSLPATSLACLCFHGIVAGGGGGEMEHGDLSDAGGHVINMSCGHVMADRARVWQNGPLRSETKPSSVRNSEPMYNPGSGPACLVLCGLHHGKNGNPGWASRCYEAVTNMLLRCYEDVMEMM